MKTYKTKIFILFILAIFSISCSKSDDNPKIEKTYLSKENHSYGSFKWNYNSDNILETIVFTTSDPISNSSYIYTVIDKNNLGYITTATIDYQDATSEDLLIENSYNNEGKIISVVNKKILTSGQKNKTIIEYIGNQVKHSNYNQSNLLSSVVIFSLSADKKNILEVKFYNSANELDLTYQYSNLDTKKTVSSLMTVGYLNTPFQENNPGSYTIIDAFDGSSITINSTFQYNEDGYPLSKTTTPGESSTYEYFKK